MRFDWTDLQIFLHVCEAGSMTGAAARCHLTLAAVSARMRGLEEANGVVLLQRQPRGVVPTAAGEVLAGHARLMFEQVQRLQRDLLHARSEARPQMVLLANSAALVRPLAEPVAELAGSGRRVLVRESPSEATVQALRSGVADVGIVSDAVEVRGLVAQELGPDPLVLVVPPAHALAARTGVGFEEALAHPWVTWGEQGALSTHLLMRALALGARMDARVAFPRAGGVLRLVARGVGVTVLPRAVVERHRADAAVTCVPLEESWARRRLLACHPEGGDPARARLAQSLVRHWPKG